MGLTVEADARGQPARARSAAARERTVLLCAHLDTVDGAGADRAGRRRRRAGRTRTTRSSAPTTRPPSRCSSRSRGARASRARRSAIELLLTVEEEDALAGAKAFDASVLRADFGYVFDHATPIGEIVVALADLLPARAPTSTAAPRTRASGPRPAAARSLAAAQAIAAMPHGRIDERDDRERRVDPRAASAPPTSCPSAAGCSPRRARSIPSASRPSSPRWSTRSTTAPRRRVRRRRRRARSSSTATAEGARRRRSCAAEAALRACGYEPEPDRHRRRLGRQRARASRASTCVNLANGTERNHEPTERVSVAALEGMLDVCLALLDEVAADACVAGGMSSRFERLEARTVFEGAIVDVSRATLPPRGRRGGRRASGSRIPARSAIVAHDDEHVWLVRQPREAIGVPDLLELPAGKLDEEGETPLECAPARAGRGDRQGRRALGAPRRPTTPRPASPTSSATSSSPPACSDDAGHEIEDERIDIEPRPLAELDARSPTCRDAKTIIGLLLLRARLRPPERRVAPGRAAAAARRTRSPWPSRRPLARTQPFEHLLLDFLAYLEFERGLSRNTLEAYRSDLLQFGDWLGRTGHDPLARRPRRAERLRSTSSPTGREDKPPAAPATLQRKVACLRSFYRHLRRDGAARPTTRPPTCARRKPEPQAAAGAQPRRGRRAAAPAARDRARRAARPRAAGDDVRLRAARVGGDRAGDRRRRPRGRGPARPRQGLQGAARADRLRGGRARSPPTSQRGRPRLVGDRWEARLFVNQRGGGLTRQGLYKIVQRHAATAGLASKMSPHTLRHTLRHAPAGRRLRPALAAGDARARRHRHDAALHAPVGRAAQGRLLRRPSAGPHHLTRRGHRRRRTGSMSRRAAARLRHRRSTPAARASCPTRPTTATPARTRSATSPRRPAGWTCRSCSGSASAPRCRCSAARRRATRSSTGACIRSGPARTRSPATGS